MSKPAHGALRVFGILLLLGFSPLARAADLYGGGSDLDAELRGLLSSPDPEKRRLGIEQLAGLEPRIAAQHLMARLKDADASVRARAARALGPLALHDAAPLLLTGLSDADSGMRSACAEALGQFGALPPGLSSRAAGVLGRALGDSQYEVRMEALRAIERLLHGRLLGAGEGQQLLGPVLLRVEDEHVGVRRAAASVLGRLGPLSLPAELSRRAVVALLGRLSDTARDVRAQALESLTLLGAGEAASAALRLLQDPAEDVRRQALLYLGRVAYAPAVPLLIETFETGNDVLRPAAAQALGSVAAANKSPISESAARSLVQSLLREETRPLARQALIEVGGAAVPLVLSRLRQGGSGQAEVGALVDLLRDLGSVSAAPRALSTALRKQVSEELFVELRRGRLPREQVVDALAAQCEPSSVQLLVGLLFDAEVAVRRRAVAGLQKPGLLDLRAADALTAATRDSDREVRTQAVLLLGELPLSGARPPWLPRLLELAKAADPETRLAAVQALGRIAQPGGGAPPAAAIAALLEGNAQSALIAALTTPGEGLAELRVRRAAAQALGQLVAAAPAQRGVVAAALLPLARRGHGAGEWVLVEVVTAIGHVLRDAPSGSLPPGQGEAVRKLLLDLATAGGDAESGDAALSCEALDALGALRDPESAVRIARLIDGRHGHRDALRRARAASALGNLLGSSATETSLSALISTLKEDSDGRVIAEAAWAIGKLPRGSDGTTRAGAALRQILTRRDGGGSGYLEPSLHGGFDRGVRTNVLGALFRLEQADVSDAQWLGDADAGVRANAALLLGALKVRSPGMEARLRNLTTTDEDHRVRQSAERALASGGRTTPASERRHFLTMFQMDHDRRPLSETAYRLTLPDGLVRVGLTDRRGVAREELLPAGSCDVELLHEPPR